MFRSYFRRRKNFFKQKEESQHTYIKTINYWNDDKTDWFYNFIEHHQLNLYKHEIYIFSVFSDKRLIKHVPKDSIKLFFSGECVQPVGFPKFHQYSDYYLSIIDLSMSYDHINHQKYLRFPLWILYCFSPNATFQDIDNFVNTINNQSLRNKPKNRFACLLARHDKLAHARQPPYELLNPIENIQCAGKFLNNTDELITVYQDDKICYLKEFRFNLCPENCNSKGYVTEKIFDAIRTGCIPVYWGSNNMPEPEILNPDAILFYDPNSKEKQQALYDKVSNIWHNEKSYQEFSAIPPFKENANEIIWQYFINLKNRLKDIIDK